MCLRNSLGISWDNCYQRFHDQKIWGTCDMKRWSVVWTNVVLYEVITCYMKWWRVRWSIDVLDEVLTCAEVMTCDMKWWSVLKCWRVLWSVDVCCSVNVCWRVECYMKEWRGWGSFDMWNQVMTYAMKCWRVISTWLNSPDL